MKSQSIDFKHKVNKTTTTRRPTINNITQRISHLEESFKRTRLLIEEVNMEITASNFMTFRINADSQQFFNVAQQISQQPIEQTHSLQSHPSTPEAHITDTSNELFNEDEINDIPLFSGEVNIGTTMTVIINPIIKTKNTLKC